MSLKEKLSESDQKVRDEIIWGDWKPSKDSHPLAVMTNAPEAYNMGGTRHFGDGGAIVDAAKVELLIKEGFLDPEHSANSRPSTAEFLVLLKESPGSSAIGFAVTRTRWDTRVSIDGVQFPCKGEPPKEAVKAFTAFLKKFRPNEKYFGPDLIRLWWD